MRRSRHSGESRRGKGGRSGLSDPRRRRRPGGKASADVSRPVILAGAPTPGGGSLDPGGAAGRLSVVGDTVVLRPNLMGDAAKLAIVAVSP